MRYEEIAPDDLAIIALINETTDPARAAQKRAEQQQKARKKIADANHKKAVAARQYQDKMRAANDRQRDALRAVSKAP
jgi:hypothetical protein